MFFRLWRNLGKDGIMLTCDTNLRNLSSTMDLIRSYDYKGKGEQ